MSLHNKDHTVRLAWLRSPTHVLHYSQYVILHSFSPRFFHLCGLVDVIETDMHSYQIQDHGNSGQLHNRNHKFIYNRTKFAKTITTNTEFIIYN